MLNHHRVKWAVWSAVGLFVFFVILGSTAEQAVKADPPKPRTEYVTKTVKVRVPVVPDACREAIRVAGALTEAQIMLSDSVDESIDLLSRARSAVVSGDAATINDAESALRALERRTQSARYDLLAANSRYNAQMKACPEADTN